MSLKGAVLVGSKRERRERERERQSFDSKSLLFLKSGLANLVSILDEYDPKDYFEGCGLNHQTLSHQCYQSQSNRFHQGGKHICMLVMHQLDLTNEFGHHFGVHGRKHEASWLDSIFFNSYFNVLSL